MPRLVSKFKYMKTGSGGKSIGGYAKYIATREGVEKLDDRQRHAPATVKQEQLIRRILQDFPDSKDSHEYRDYQKEKTIGNASEFITRALEENMDKVAEIKTYADYIATRPRAERFGSHGLFTNEGEEVQLTKVSRELNEYSGNVYTVILSLRREDAARLGYDCGSRWRDFLRSNTSVIADNLKIPSNHLRWYAAFHDEGHHPHIHMIAYSSVPGEGYLSDKGVEKMRSRFAGEIFSQDMLHTYKRQTECRDRLRSYGRESVAQIVEEINNGYYSNPQVEQLLIQLSQRLANTSGKKVYGYLKSDVKAIVDEIVAELAKDENIRKLYDLWYEQREDVLRTYTDHFPERVPLEQNKEFKSIRNAVIQEALRLDGWIRPTPAKQTAFEPLVALVPEEEAKPEAEYPEEEPPRDAPEEPEMEEPPPKENRPFSNTEKVVIAASAGRLLQSLSKLISGKYQEQEKKLRQGMDRKQRREIQEKKQAMGLRD